MKYRDRIDIISQILKIANGGDVTRTKIMYRGLLSYAQIKEYLMLLTEKELLRYDKETQTFRTTEKGLRFLDISTASAFAVALLLLNTQWKKNEIGTFCSFICLVSWLLLLVLLFLS
jgi:predicted transcriptional regulator